MAQHKVSYWEIRMERRNSKDPIVFGKDYPVNSGTTKRSIERQLYDAILSEKNTPYYVGPTLKSTKRPKYYIRVTHLSNFVDLNGQQTWPSTSLRQAPPNGVWFWMKIDSGLDNDFRESIDGSNAKPGKSAAVKPNSQRNHYQLREHRAMFLFPHNSDKAYVALEGIAGTTVSSCVESYCEHLLLKTVGINFERVTDAQAILDAIGDMTAAETKFVVPKSSSAGRQKADNVVMSTGLEASQGVAVKDELIKLVKKATGIKVSTKKSATDNRSPREVLDDLHTMLMSFFGTKEDRSPSAVKIILRRDGSGGEKTLDVTSLQSIVDFIDVPIEANKVGNDQEFLRIASELARYV